MCRREDRMTDLGSICAQRAATCTHNLDIFVQMFGGELVNNAMDAKRC